MITTTIMIKLGRVSGNKMVNMQLTNKKLLERGSRMISEELNLPCKKSKQLLIHYGSVKKAIESGKGTKDFYKNVKLSLDSYQTLLNKGETIRDKDNVEEAYSLDGLNISGVILDILVKIYLGDAESLPPCNLVPN